MHQLTSDEYTARPNIDLFRQFAFDAYERREDIKPTIEKSLTTDWRYERLETVSKAFFMWSPLRC